MKSEIAIVLSFIALTVAFGALFRPIPHAPTPAAQVSAGQWTLDQVDANLSACCRLVYTYQRVLKVFDDGYGHVLVTLRLASSDAPRRRFTLEVELDRASYEVVSYTAIPS